MQRDSENEMRHSSTVSLIIAFYAVLVTQCRGADAPPAPTVSVDQNTWLFEPTLITISPDRRTAVADLLASYVSYGINFDAPDATTQAARFLGIALRIDSQDRKAVLAAATLARARFTSQPAPSGWSKTSLAIDLARAADEFYASQSPTDRTVAAYLYDLVFLVDPENLEALYRTDAGRAAGRRLNWDWATQARPQVGDAKASADAGKAKAAPTQVCVFQEHAARVFSIAFAPGNHYAFSAGEDHAIRMWETTSAHEIRRFEGFATEGELCVSPDGRYLCGPVNGHAWVWEIATGKVVSLLQCDGRFWNAVFTPDGTKICLGTTPPKLFSVVKGEDLKVFIGLDELNRRILLSSTQRYLLTVSRTKMRLVDLRNLEEAEYSTPQYMTEQCKTIRFSGDDTRIVFGYPPNVAEYELASKTLHGKATQSNPAVAATFDGATLLMDRQSGLNLDLIDGRTLQKLGKVGPRSTSLNRAFCFSADGRFLAISADKSVYLWELPVN
jgi:WD40 repeat protein